MSKLLTCLYFVLNLIAFSFGANESLSALKTEHIVPEILETLPLNVLEVYFSSGVRMSIGGELTPLQVKSPPSNLTWPVEPNAHYVLLFTDPDSPSRAAPRQNREKLHWLVVNISGNDVHKGEEYAEYRGSGPQEGTGLHRYVMSVYKQSQAHLVLHRTKIVGPAPDLRVHFNTKQFAKENNLGVPVAANFFHAQFHK